MFIRTIYRDGQTYTLCSDNVKSPLCNLEHFLHAFIVKFIDFEVKKYMYNDSNKKFMACNYTDQNKSIPTLKLPVILICVGYFLIYVI